MDESGQYSEIGNVRLKVLPVLPTLDTPTGRRHSVQACRSD